MQPQIPNDLRHIDSELNKLHDNVTSDRAQAQKLRDRAMQHIQQGSEGKATYNTREAEKLENKAMELESTIPQFEAAYAMIEKQINDLQSQRDTVVQQNPARASEIDQQINQLRG